MKKKRFSKAILDPYAFKNLNTNMIIKQEHLDMLSKHIIETGYKIGKGKTDKTFEEVFETLKQTIIQIKKLKESYEQ